MAVVVTDQRTIISEADSTTGWTGSSSPSAFTSDPNPVEAGASLGMAVSNSTDELYFTMGASVDMLNTPRLVYVWVLANGTMDTRANGGIQLVLGDGTNRVGYHLAGSDVAAFRHEAGPVGWQCLVLDTESLPTFGTTVYAGTEGNLNLAAITQVGAAFKTLSKALGGAANCFVDIMRYGSKGQGLLITGGTSGDPGTFAEIAAEDRNTGNQKAHGIIRELGDGVYSVQGPLTFGDNSGTTATWFEDTDAVVVFESRGLASNSYSVTVQGNATGSTTFKLGNKVGTGDTATGSDGCIIASPAGVGAQFVATDADLQDLRIYGSTLRGFEQGITLSADATNGPTHEFIGNTVAGCGRLDSGRVVVRAMTMVGSVTTTTDGAMIWNVGLTNVRNSDFNSNTRGIVFEATGTVTFTNIFFDANSFDVRNESDGLVTINISGGDTPTVENAGTSTTDVVNTVNYTVTGMVVGSELTIVRVSDSTELFHVESTATGEESYQHDGTTTNVDVLVAEIDHIFLAISDTLGSQDQTLLVQQQTDRFYSNP